MDLYLYYIVGILTAGLISGYISFFSVLFKPEWSDDFGDAKVWRKLGVISITASLVAAGLALYGNGRYMESGVELRQFLYGVSVAVLVAILTTATVQSIATDMKLRLVDRRMLNTSTLISALFAVVVYLTNGWVKIDNLVTIGISVIMLLFAAFVYIFVFSIGASDARALALVGVAAVPVLGWSYFIWASLAAGIFFMVAGFTVAIVKRSVRESFPAVPMLLGPYWLFSILSTLVFLPALVALPS